MTAKLNDMVMNAPLQPEDNPILQGNFAPVAQEVDRNGLEVIGTLPPELNGTLLRDGPNPVNPQANHHWFIGDGMLHAITFENGAASSYRNRWVRTADIEEKLGLKAAPMSDTKMMVQGSGNVNVISHGDRILALPEIGLPYEMDLTLETRREYDFEGKLASSMTAHPKIDGKTGEMLFFGYDFAPPYLRYHRVNKAGELTQTVDVELPEMVMMHDFGVTATRVIFMDLPIVGNLGLFDEGYNMPFSWSEEHQARLGIMDRNANEDTVKWIDIDPCYVFHPLNSYDDGDNIVMDVVRYNKAFTSPQFPEYEKGSQLVRWTIDVKAGEVHSRVLSTIDQEFPRVNPRVECYPHRYGYVLEVGGPHGFKGLLKHDLETGETLHHDVGAECAAGEPVFVPTGEAEDEGYILSVVYNSVTQLSEIRVIDARNFSAPPVAVVKLQARIPFGFHGNFVASTGR
jgi:carotenoid cleavage dioxygenase-like enzyme